MVVTHATARSSSVSCGHSELDMEYTLALVLSGGADGEPITATTGPLATYGDTPMRSIEVSKRERENPVERVAPFALEWIERNTITIDQI